MDAYHAGAIDVAMLKSEQSRIGAELVTISAQLHNLDAEAIEWQEILEQAMVFASNCAKAYRLASDRGRRVLNKAVVKRIGIRDRQDRRCGVSCPIRPSLFTRGVRI